jgi:protein O-GlcNAc transferase
VGPPADSAEWLRLRALACARRGQSLVSEGHIRRGIAALRQALSLRPQWPEALNELGEALLLLGRIERGIAAIYEAHGLCPSLAPIQSNLLLALQYSPSLSPEIVADAHRQWGLQFPEVPARSRRRHDGPLRIGYLSPNFCRDPEACFTEPVFRSHDRDRFAVYGYSSVRSPDDYTERFRRLADRWRPLANLSDEDAAAVIRADAPDILVEPTGHFGQSRLRLLARRLAPVQVSWSTYPCSTGLTSIEHRVTDSRADPPGLTEHLYTERLWRLPDAYVCYQPPGDAPAISPLPALSTGSITFGSFNRFQKINDLVLDCWGAILRNTPHSRLLMHYIFSPHPGVPDDCRMRMIAAFKRRGIAPDRLQFLGGLPHSAHLEVFQNVDVCLDTFPYNGMTTTCESLWMGVPVITLEGRSHISRVGLSLVSAAGLTGCVAKTQDDYVRLASESARDLPSLAALRRSLRQRVRDSALTDAGRYTRNLEAAYLEMYRA